MSYLGIDWLKSIAGIETDTTKSVGSAAASTPTNAAHSAYLSTYSEEMAELAETKTVDFEKYSSSASTIEEIDKEIEEKQNELTELQTKTAEFIQKCKEEIQRIFTEGTEYIPKEVQTNYSNELDSILNKTKVNTNLILENMALINENEIVIEQAEKEREQKEEEIQEKENKIDVLRNKGDNASLNEIENLQNEISDLRFDIRLLNGIINWSEKTIESATNECKELETSNVSLSKEQDGLMAKCLDEYYQTHNEEDRVYEDSTLANEIQTLNGYIDEANTNLCTSTVQIAGDINNLLQIKAFKIQETIKAQQAALNAASSAQSSAQTQNYSVIGGNYTGELPVNNELASIAQNMASSMGTTGWCLKGVNNSLEKAYGFRLSYNSAYQAIPALQNRSDFTEVTNQYASSQDLKNLPAGAIVVWENSSSHPHGHISIALGNGQEASDHIQNQCVNYGTQYHVFVKTA